MGHIADAEDGGEPVEIELSIDTNDDDEGGEGRIGNVTVSQPGGSTGPVQGFFSSLNRCWPSVDQRLQ